MCFNLNYSVSCSIYINRQREQFVQRSGDCTDSAFEYGSASELCSPPLWCGLIHPQPDPDVNREDISIIHHLLLGGGKLHKPLQDFTHVNIRVTHEAKSAATAACIFYIDVAQNVHFAATRDYLSQLSTTEQSKARSAAVT